jgi:hypothetical protein
LPARLLEEQPVDLAGNNSASISGKAKSKDTKSGEKNNGSGKKDEPKPKLTLVQTLQEPAPVILKPPIQFRTQRWETQPESATISSSKPDEAFDGRVEPIDVLATPGPRAAVAIPTATEAAPAARIAFGLRLTPADPKTNTATESSVPAPQTGRVQDLRYPATFPMGAEIDRLPEQISAVHATADPNQGPSGDRSPGLTPPKLTVPDRTLRPDQPVSSNAKVPDSSSLLGIAQDHVDAPGVAGAISVPLPEARPAPRADSASSTKPAPVASPTTASRQVARSPEQPADPESAGQKTLSTEPQGPSSSSDNLPAPDPRTIAATISIPSERSANLYDPAAGAAEHKPAPENNSQSTSADRHDTAPVRTNPEGVVASKAQQQQRRQVEELDDGVPTAKILRPQAAERRDLPAPNRDEGRSNPTRLEALAQPAQGPGAPDTRMGRSLADPPQPAKVAIEPETNAAPRPQPARQISLKLTGEDSARVDVELSERAGKVQVAVRTPDRELAKSLQTDLGDLVGRLETKGFKTEAWLPGTDRHTPSSAPEQSGFANSEGDPRHAGSGTGQQQGRQGQNGSNQRQQARWMAQLRETLSTEETRIEKE